MKLSFIIIISLIIQHAKSQNENLRFKLDNDGIIVEDFDSININENRYNLDNTIYTVKKKFFFDYYYLDTNNIKYLMTSDTIHDWTLDMLELKNPNSVNQIIMTVSYGLSPFFPEIKDYNQTIIKYDFSMFSGEFWSNEMTGLIENNKNIWMHPPRTDLFKILEINPFPYIKAPYIIGNKWDWNLKIGSFCSDKRWLEWTGIVVNHYEYEITRKLNLETKIGNLVCYEVKGIAESKLGRTELISYFNVDNGFVKLAYTNIDKSKIIIEIDKIE